MDYKAQLVSDNLWIIDTAIKKYRAQPYKQELILELCELASCYTQHLVKEDFSFYAYNHIIDIAASIEEPKELKHYKSKLSYIELYILDLILRGYNNEYILKNITTSSNLKINRIRLNLIKEMGNYYDDIHNVCTNRTSSNNSILLYHI